VVDRTPQRPAGSDAERNKGNRVVVRIYGEEHRLCGDAPTSYLQDLAVRVDARMREIAKANPRLGTSQVAVLAALNTMDDLVRLEAQHQRVLALWEREWRKLEQANHAAPGAAPGAAAAKPRPI